jgi:methylthioribose-1-phosphate isomerase
MCRAIGKFGADILDMNCNVLTHCNTGALATGGIGTALGIIKTAWELGKIKHVYIDETRPLFQGSRLTAFEIQKLNIPATVITDSTAASLMLEKKVDAVIIGADRITRKGDVVNKIGSYNLAVLSKYHKIPFYVAAPSSTIDLQLVSGGEVPIEHRDSEELSKVGGARLTPQGFKIFSPAFDVTPFGLITAIVTEKGVWREIVGISLENFLESKG